MSLDRVSLVEVSHPDRLVGTTRYCESISFRHSVRQERVSSAE